MSTGAPGVTERVRRSRGNLSKAEQRVPRTLLSGPPTIGLESVSHVAAHTGVSGASWTRRAT